MLNNFTKVINFTNFPKDLLNEIVIFVIITLKINNEYV